jgi:hypothetical protein
MPRTGVVTATNLNLRETPGGPVLKVLPRGTEVEVIEDQGDFLKISAAGETGFVKASFIDFAPEEPLPGPASGGFHFDGTTAVAPDGTRFAKKFKLGVYNNGDTTIGQFVSMNPDLFDVSPSRLRVMQAVSNNEGRLEAINTWDNAFLTFGAFQWTVGPGNGAGELPALLDRLKRRDSGTFNRYFGDHGLDISTISQPPGVTPTGFFSLNGTRLSSASQKERLRSLEWAYQFWLAGHDDVVRTVEVEHAIGRVDLFYRNPAHKIGQFMVGDYVTSEYGVALLLDEHVNRPGHVPGTLAKAVESYVTESGRLDPSEWNDTDEARLLTRYISFRANTNMTDSNARADKIRAEVEAGKASAARESYQP